MLYFNYEEGIKVLAFFKKQHNINEFRQFKQKTRHPKAESYSRGGGKCMKQDNAKRVFH